MTEAARGWTDPYLAIYRPVPHAGSTVCSVCHSGPNTGFQICRSCVTTMRQVSSPTRLVLPISLFERGDQLHTFLREYKSADPTAARTPLTVIAATLARFATVHQPCIVDRIGGPVDLVTTVPSTGGRRGVHPLWTVVEQSRLLHPLHRSVLHWTGRPAGHNNAADDAFAVTTDLSGARVLLIDDTFTTGARAQSAVSALRRGNARTVAVLAVGRIIDPQWNENCRGIWEQARQREFRFDECCWCPNG